MTADAVDLTADAVDFAAGVVALFAGVVALAAVAVAFVSGETDLAVNLVDLVVDEEFCFCEDAFLVSDLGCLMPLNVLLRNFSTRAFSLSVYSRSLDVTSSDDTDDAAAFFLLLGLTSFCSLVSSPLESSELEMDESLLERRNFLRSNSSIFC